MHDDALSGIKCSDRRVHRPAHDVLGRRWMELPLGAWTARQARQGLCATGRHRAVFRAVLIRNSITQFLSPEDLYPAADRTMGQDGLAGVKWL
jgi:hypothetical protein